MIKALLGEGFTAEFLEGGDDACKRFPEGLPKGKTFNLILFAGCNLLNSIFTEDLEKNKTAIQQVESLLTEKPKGCVIFVESKSYVNRDAPEHYEKHKLSAKIEKLFTHQAAGWQDIKDKYKSTVDHWNERFLVQQTNKEKYGAKYILYFKQPDGAKAETQKTVTQKAETEAPKEEKCKKLLGEIKNLFSAEAAPTKLMEFIVAKLKAHSVEATIGRKGTLKKTTMNTSNINALGGEEECRQKLKAIKAALQDTTQTAQERVELIKAQVGLQVRRNTTAKASNNSNSNNSAQTPEADFFDLFEADDPSSRDLATLNEVFKMNLLEDDAVYDKEAVESAAVLKKGAEKTTFSVDQGKSIKEAIIRKKLLKELEGKPEAEKEAAVQAKIAEEAAKSLEDFRRLYGNFAGGCEDVKITLECMHASGSNSDCFFHSFFGATCAFYRMAKVRGKPYNAFVTRFRQEIVPKIIEFFFAEEDDDKPVVTMSAEELIEELGSPGQFLPDDLYTIITYYYDCAILLVRPVAADGIRVAPLIGENTEATYGISNSAGVHFEPLRILNQDTYKLSDSQAKCLSYTYSQLSGTTATVDIKRFKEMGKVSAIPTPGGDGAMVYDEAAMLARLSEGDKIRESDQPGDVTRVYMGIRGEGYDETKTAQVRKLQEMIQRLTKNYKDRQMFANAKLAPESQDLEDSIQLLQQGIVDGDKGDAELDAKGAQVAEFVTKLTAEERAEAARKAKAEAAAAAKKAKAEAAAAKKAAKKQGGRRTLRKERRGHKTPRA